MHINFWLESMGCYPLETFASQAADCRGGGVFCKRQDVDSLILGGSVSFENFGALCALNKAALEQLTMASSLWKDTWVLFPECSCVHLCSSRLLRAQWAARQPRNLLGSAGGQLTHFFNYTYEGILNNGFVHFWSRPCGANKAGISFIINAPELLIPGSDSTITLGFTDATITGHMLARRLQARDARLWSISIASRTGFLPREFCIHAMGSRICVPNELTSQQDNMPLSAANEACLIWSASELRLYWNRHLAAACVMPDWHPSEHELPGMWAHCCIHTQEAFHRSNPCFAVGSRFPQTREGLRLPVAAMRMLDAAGLCASDLSVHSDRLVYLTPETNVSEFETCVRGLNRVEEAEVFVGFGTSRNARHLDELLCNAGAHGPASSAWGLYLHVARGAILCRHAARSWAQATFEDVPASSRMPASSSEQNVQVKVICKQADAGLQTAVNDEGWQAWAATQPPRASRDLKRARAAVMVRLNCGPRDLRQVLKTFAQLEITVTVSLALSGCSSPRNILATRPWMDHCGGSSAWEIRTPSSSEADNTEFESVSGIVWLQTYGPAEAQYLAVSGVGHGILAPGLLTAEEAATWFLFVFSQRVPPCSLAGLVLQLPTEVRCRLYLLPAVLQVCTHPYRPRLYMLAALARAGLDARVSVQFAAEEILPLYAFVWPKAALKEGLLRAGVVTSASYQTIQTVMDFNATAQDSNCVIAAWPASRALEPGIYVVVYGEVHSVLQVRSGITWWCGLWEAHLNTMELSAFLALSGIGLHRLFAKRNEDPLRGQQPFGRDIRGGASLRLPQAGETIMILEKHWLDMILSGQKTLELRHQSKKPGLVWLACQKTIYGSAFVSQSEQLDFKRFRDLVVFHCYQSNELPYKCTWGLWLRDVQALGSPLDFEKPRGPIGFARVRWTSGNPEVATKYTACAPGDMQGGGPDKCREFGLPNFANNCYINAVLQGLFHTPSFLHLCAECHTRLQHDPQAGG